MDLKAKKLGPISCTFFLPYRQFTTYVDWFTYVTWTYITQLILYQFTTCTIWLVNVGSGRGYIWNDEFFGREANGFISFQGDTNQPIIRLLSILSSVQMTNGRITFAAYNNHERYQLCLSNAKLQLSKSSITWKPRGTKGSGQALVKASYAGTRELWQVLPDSHEMSSWILIWRDPQY